MATGLFLVPLLTAFVIGRASVEWFPPSTSDRSTYTRKVRYRKGFNRYKR